jgi:cytochrome c oxidase cbb3-type subunit III
VTKIISLRWLSLRYARLAGGLLVMSACWAVGFWPWSGEQAVVYAQKSKQATSTGPSHKQDSEAGRELFESSCAACHGLDGRGGEKGPNIATRAEISRRSDGEILAVLQNGIPGAGMPAFARLGDTKLQAVVQHLRSLQGLTEKNEVAGNAEEGKRLFFKEGGCASCHMINGAGGFLGSDLSNYGAITSVGDMREQITNHDLSLRTKALVVSTRDGRQLSGFSRNEDNFSLQLQTLDGNFHFLDKSVVASVDHSSPAAVDAENKSSKNDLDAIISYLVRVAQNSQDGVKWKMQRKHNEEED